jgi:hypothetical protein
MRANDFCNVSPPDIVTLMNSTLLTKRRAVDHCRVRSSLCRMCR